MCYYWYLIIFLKLWGLALKYENIVKVIFYIFVGFESKFNQTLDILINPQKSVTVSRVLIKFTDNIMMLVVDLTRR